MKRSRLKLPREQYKALCMAVMLRDGWKCRVCKRRSNLHVHHIIYRSHGGDDADWNLVTLCNLCHEAVHNRYLLLRPRPDQIMVDANKDEFFIEFLDGWTPGKDFRKWTAAIAG